METSLHDLVPVFADSASYAGQLEACEVDGDWLKAVELLAEARSFVSVYAVSPYLQHPGRWVSRRTAWPSSSDMEVFAALQVRALKLDLPGEAFEPAVRLCAQSGQWQKAVSILEQAHAQGSVSSPTTVAVFTTLLRQSQPAAALRLLKVPSRCQS